MALRNEDEYESIYGSTGTLFPDNTTGLISEADMRQLGQDTKDSVLFRTGILGGLSDGLAINCGEVDLSSDALPTTGGSGTSGAIKRGNYFRVSVGTNAGISGVDIPVNAKIEAKQDNPTLISHWWIQIV
jgi:hypothetical protein